MFNLIDFSATHLEGKSKLEFYSIMFQNSDLERDLKFSNSKQEALINQFCNMGIKARLSLAESAIAEFRNALGITYDDEKEMFTKIFIRDYLKNTEERNDLGLKDGYSAGEIFKNFASEKLRKDKEFVTIILKLDGRNLPFMNIEFQNDVELLELSIKSDTSKDVDSFTKMDTPLKHNPYLAVEFIKKYKYNKNASGIKIYNELFKKDENGNYPREIFKDNEQLSWISNTNFVKEILNIVPEFTTHILEGGLQVSNNALQKKKV